MLISEERERQKRQEEQFRLFLWFFIVLFAAMLCFRLMTTFWLTPVEVEGVSMQNTLHGGDVLLVNRLDKTVERGDVVVIDKDGSGDLIIKRVVGLAGDELWTEHGTLYRKRCGETAAEVADEGYSATFRSDKTFLPAPSLNDMEKITVPEGCVFALGDNRTQSQDSRYYGAFPTDLVVGVVPEGCIKNKTIVKAFFG